MSEHKWERAGNDDSGQGRYVCSVCRVGRAWPGTPAECGGVERVVIVRGKFAAPKVMIRADVEPNRICGVCSRPYHSAHAGSKYCGQPCAKRAWDLQHNASQRRTARSR